MNNEIEKYTVDTFDKLTECIKNELNDSIKYIFRELVKKNCVFYGKTAIEIQLNIEPTIPFKIVSNKTVKFFLPIFKDIIAKYNVNYKIDKLPNIFIYKLNLQTALISHYTKTNNFEKYVKKINDVHIIDPLISLMDIYFIYSTPLMNSNQWLDLVKLDPKFINTLTYKNDITYKNIDKLEKIYHKNFSIFKNSNFLKEDIILTGIHSYNEMMNSNFNDTINLMVYDSKDIIDKIQELYKNRLSVTKYQNSFIKYFNYYYILKYKNIHLFTIYEMKDAYIYYHNTKRTNFHTTVFMLLFKTIIEKTEKYVPLINNLLIEGSKKDLLSDNKFKCFEVGYLDNAIKNLIKQRLQK